MGHAWLMLYHEVKPEAESLWAVPPDSLARAVASAHGRRLALVSVDDAITDSRDVVALTFDDAFLSVYDIAFPLLSALGVPATVFVPVDYVGRRSSYDEAAGLRGAEPIMSWAQLAELAANGWAIESHGCSHTPLSGMSPARLDDELRRSKGVIEDALARRVRGFAYPYGIVPAPEDDTVDRLLEAAGYEYGVLAAGGVARTPPRRRYRVPREPVAPGQRISFTVRD